MNIDKIEELKHQAVVLDRRHHAGDVFKQTLKLFEEMGGVMHRGMQT